MYSNVHGVVGTSLVLAAHQITGDTTAAIVWGGAAAFISHDVLDSLGEKSYGNLETSIRWELYPLWIFAMAAVWSGHWWLYAVGWIAGNGMDLIDKRMYLSIFWPDRFPFGKYFACHRRTPAIQFTLGQTRLATIVSTLAIVGVSL